MLNYNGPLEDCLADKLGKVREDLDKAQYLLADNGTEREKQVFSLLSLMSMNLSSVQHYLFEADDCKHCKEIGKEYAKQSIQNREESQST